MAASSATSHPCTAAGSRSAQRATVGRRGPTTTPLPPSDCAIANAYSSVWSSPTTQGERPAKTGSRIRARFKLADVKVRPSGWVQVTNDVTIEIDGSAKPALTARWLTLAFVAPKAS